MKLGGDRVLYLWLSLSTRLTRVEGVFSAKPQNTTVTETSDATFHCSVLNFSFTVLWLVNGSDADFAIFEDRGLTVQLINDTTSRLVIRGYKKNNNTLVECVALQYVNYHLKATFHSEVALLVVKEYHTTDFTVVTAPITMTKSKPAIASSPKDEPPMFDQKDSVSLSKTVGSAIILSMVLILIICATPLTCLLIQKRQCRKAFANANP